MITACRTMRLYKYDSSIVTCFIYSRNRFFSHRVILTIGLFLPIFLRILNNRGAGSTYPLVRLKLRGILVPTKKMSLRLTSTFSCSRVACGAGWPAGAGRVLLSARGLCGPSFFVAGLRSATSPQQARTIPDSTEFIIHEWNIFTRY